jgi:dolichol-phosphate mannosyltransferase
MNFCDSPEVTVVLPAYKEAESLKSLLPQLKAALALIVRHYEILVIDARVSVDETLEVCERNQIRHVFRRNGNFYGDAVRTGIQESRGEHILIMDADGSHNPAEIASLWLHRNNFDVVIGSRYSDGGSTENPRILIFMSWLVNLTFRVCFRLSCKDVTNSFRLYRGARLRAVRLQSQNFDIVEELLIKICSGPDAGTWKEVPIKFERRKAGESKRNLFAFALTYFWTLIRLLRIKHSAGRSS